MRSSGRLIPAEDCWAAPSLSFAWGCCLLLAGVVPPGKDLLAALVATSLWAHQKGQGTSDPPRESCCMRGSLYPSIKDVQTQRALLFLWFLGTIHREEFRAACYSHDHCNFLRHKLLGQFILGKLWLGLKVGHSMWKSHLLGIFCQAG